MTPFLTCGKLLLEVETVNVTRLKVKNQITIPQVIVNLLKLHQDELFTVEVEKNYIKLTPVEIKPRYTAAELKAVDRIVEREKSQKKTKKSGKEFSHYTKRIGKCGK